MKVGFLNNQIDNRGTGNAVYDYAHYNEEILGNKSVILTFLEGNHDKLSVERFQKRFEDIRLIPPYLNGYIDTPDLDFLYHIKSGKPDGVTATVPYGVHAVFEYEPHGDRYAVISEWMGGKFKSPFVPHIVDLPKIDVNFREGLGIPRDAVVFGRHGGYDTFDISWVWEVIRETLHRRSDVWFLFLNTEPVLKHPKILYYPNTADRFLVKAFVNTCDAMLHARSRGETFGLSVADFAASGKPVITYGGSYERAHIYEMRGSAITYEDEYELEKILHRFKRPKKNHFFYTAYTPQSVMKTFKEVFLS